MTSPVLGVGPRHRAVEATGRQHGAFHPLEGRLRHLEDRPVAGRSSPRRNGAPARRPGEPWLMGVTPTRKHGRNGAPARRPGEPVPLAPPWTTLISPQWSPGPKAGGTTARHRLHRRPVSRNGAPARRPGEPRDARSPRGRCRGRNGAPARRPGEPENRGTASTARPGRNGAPARRPGERGTIGSREYADAVPQWSPGPKAGGTWARLAHGNPGPRAAMEPRPEGRGNPLRASLPDPKPMPPQWSPGPKAGGTWRWHHDCAVRRLAAMEPRPEGRGNCESCSGGSPARVPQWSPGPKAGGTWSNTGQGSMPSGPQWSPGPKAGGTPNSASKPSSVPQPQWSPGPKAGGTLGYTRAVQPRRAAMEPRPEGRGNRRDLMRIGTGLRCRNGAPARRPGEPSHLKVG